MSPVWRRLPCSVLAVCALALGMPAALAQDGVDINSSPSLVGSGARAMGMGGAFIAVADDATAASWNPAGLTQLERPELSLVYSWKRFREGFTSRGYLDPDDPFTVHVDDLNYLSFVYPIRRTIAGRNIVLSLNLQRKYDFDRSLDLRVRNIASDSGAAGSGRFLNFFARTVDVDYEQKGHLSALSPAIGFELTDRLSVGAAVNIWDSSLVPGNEWESTSVQRFNTRGFLQFTTGPDRLPMVFFPTIISKVTRHEKYEDVEGINYTFGLLWKPTQRLSLGAVYHTAYSTDVKYTRIQRSYSMGIDRFYESDLRIDWPGAVGVGVAYRFPNDKLTLSLDVTRRNWDRFVQIDPRGTRGLFPIFHGSRRISPVTGMDKWSSPHDPTYTVRLGAEYVFVDPSKARQNLLPSVRAGIFYDPEPASGRRDAWWGVRRGDGDPDDYYGVALGAGVLIKNRVNIDAAYQFRWGTNVRKDTLAGAPLLERGFSTDVYQHAFYLSTVIYF